MKVYPAIDLREGATVQLVGGDPAREEVREDDPVATALRWVDEGAGLLHVVDLDAALGHGSNLHVVERIVRIQPRPIQLGGGIRSLLDIQKRISLGASRVIVGTQGVKHHVWLEEACRIFPRRIVLAIDARGDDVAISGWQEASGLTVQAVLERVAPLPLAAVLYTNIDVEGGMKGIDARAVEDVVRHSPVPVIASGGIGSMADLDTLKALGVDAAVLGMSIYTGRIRLRDAIERIEGRKVPPSSGIVTPRPPAHRGDPGGARRVVGAYAGEDDEDAEAGEAHAELEEEPGDGLVWIDEGRPDGRPKDTGPIWGRRQRAAQPADEEEDEDDEV